MLASLLHPELPHTYLGIFIFLVLTGCGFPIPEEVFIVIAGVLSAQPDGLNWAPALVACLAGAIAGDSILYGIGYRFGHRLIARHPALAKLLHAEQEQSFEKAIQRHSFKVMLLARFMVGVRAPVYLAAGAVRMSFRRFVLTDLVCATLVVGVFFGLSYLFGEQVRNWIRRTEWIVTAVVLLAVIVGGGFLYYRYRQHILRRVFGIEPPPET